MSERDRSSEARERIARAAGQDDPAGILLLREAIDLDPSLREAYAALGRIYYRNAWLEAERSLWLPRVGVDPTDPDAHERIGWILWFTGRARSIGGSRCTIAVVPQDIPVADFRFDWSTLHPTETGRQRVVAKSK